MDRTLKCIRYLTIALALLIFASGMASAEMLVAEIELNGEKKETYFLQTSPAGDYLIRLEDFNNLGFTIESPPTEIIDQETYVSLADVEDTDLSFDEETMTLQIQAAAHLLPSRTIDLSTRHSQNVLYPRDTSLFFNYGLNYLHEGLSKEDILDFTHEIGLRYRDVLLLNDATYIDRNAGQEYIRLMTTVTHDDRTTFNRTQVGDFVASAGILGSRLMLGGISYSKNFEIDPHYIEYPTASYSGEVLTPSEIEVYMDGLRIHSEKLAPGPFNLNNINRHSGAGNLEVVITDAFGNRYRLDHPFYIEKNLLKKREHAFNYALGAMRENFGVESNDYGDAAIIAQHRVGLDDQLTLGAALEGSSDLINIRPQASLLLGPYGVLEISAGGSSGYEQSGGTFSLEYNYLNRHYDLHLLGRYSDQGYRRLIDGENPSELEETAIGIGVGYVDFRFGSLSVDYLERTKHLGTAQRIFSVSYNRQLARDLSMTSTFRQTEQIESESSIFVSLNYSPWRETQLSTRVEIGEGSDSEIVQLQKSPPLGEGYGYRVAAEHHSSDTFDDFTFNPSGQLNTRYGTFRAEIDSVSGDDSYTSYRLSAAGAMVAVGGAWGVTRPISDSFSLVKVGTIEGVKVSRNSQHVGTTNEDGNLFIPDINAFYTNHVAISDQDIPLNYSLAYNQRLLAPPYRSGSCINFPVTRMQPVVGKLKVTSAGRQQPLEYSLQTLIVAGQRYPLHTGKGGEFYIDPSEFTQNLPRKNGCGSDETVKTDDAGKNLQIEVNYAGRIYPVPLDIHASDEIFIDVGEIGPIIHE